MSKISILVSTIIIVVTAFLLAKQDAKTRTIRVDTLVLFFCFVFVQSYFLFSKEVLKTNLLINLFIVVVELLCLFLYAKFQKKTTLLSVFALGDCLFLLSIVPALYPHQYILVLIFSSTIALIRHVFLKHQKGIPFVTYGVMVFMLFNLYNLVQEFTL